MSREDDLAFAVLNIRNPDVPAILRDRLSVTVTDEELEDHAVKAETDPLIFIMDYRSAKGELTTRQIRMVAITEDCNRQPMIRAYCFLRAMPRNFRTDRIEMLCWGDTGEMIERPDLFLETLIERTFTSRALDDHRAAVIVLAAIANCDGEFHPLEAEAIADYMQSAVLDPRLERHKILNRVRALAPTNTEFRAAMRKLKKWDEGQLRPLLLGIKRLIYADGLVLPEEIERARRVTDALGFDPLDLMESDLSSERQQTAVA